MRGETGLGLIIILARLFDKMNISQKSEEKILSVLQDESELMDMIELCMMEGTTEKDLVALAETMSKKQRSTAQRR